LNIEKYAEAAGLICRGRLSEGMGRSEFVVRGCAYGGGGQEPNLLAKSELQLAEGKGLVFGRKRLVLAKGEGFYSISYKRKRLFPKKKGTSYERKKMIDF
jgi:hypothetical protein